MSATTHPVSIAPTRSIGGGFNRGLLLVGLIAIVAGCRSPRQAEAPIRPHLCVLTYNVDWSCARPELAVQIIRESRADIVCLQETTPQWEQFLRQSLGHDYPFAEFRESKNRFGGGLAFLSKFPAREIALVPSETGWFDGWIMGFETLIGSLQVLNVHLHPPVSDNGGSVRGYLFTRDDRLQEMKRFYGQRRSEIPMLIAGDFNDGEDSAVQQWLKKQGMTNALPEFDRDSPTWRWRSGILSLTRRMEHIVYSPGLHCCSARVIREGASDHFPVEGVFIRADP